MSNKLMAGLAALALLTAGSVYPAQAQELRINGSSTVANSLMIPNEREIERISGQQIAVVSSGSGSGIRTLADRGADIAMISAPLPSVVSGLNRSQPGSINGRGMVAHQVGSSEIAFLIHPTNPIRSLTSDQLFDILAGRITNWSDVGGLRMPIKIMVEPPGGGVRVVIEDRLAEWGDVLATDTYVPYEPMVIKAVSENIEMLGIASSAHVNDTVLPINLDETLEHGLYLVTRGEPDDRMIAVIEAVRGIF